MEHANKQTKSPSGNIDEQLGLLGLVTGEASGQSFWAYISFYPSKMEEYEKKLKANQKIDLLQYGIVIESGFGEKPPQDIHDYMADKYNFNK